MAFIEAERIQSSYDAIVIGSGFGSLFYTYEYLKNRPNDRVLMLERGRLHSYDWQMENKINSDVPTMDATFTRDPPSKDWWENIGFGGGTNCWWGLTPRLHPNDFRMKSVYGVGADWPFSYDDLAPYYREAEAIMEISGPDDLDPVFPGTGSYPLPANRISSLDRLWKAAQPDMHFALPCAKASRETARRGRCCSTGRCNLCPMDAKFHVFNGFSELMENPALDIAVECPVTAIDIEGGMATGVVFEAEGTERRVKAPLVVLGANAIHSPAILMRSGYEHPLLGRYFHEKLAGRVEVFLDGHDHFDAQTNTPSMNLSLYEGAHRSEYGGAVILVENLPLNGYRTEFGRWRQTVVIVVYVDCVPEAEKNRIEIDAAGAPVVKFPRFPDYTIRGYRAALEKLPELLAPLPVADLFELPRHQTIGHLQGSLRIGSARESSVIDGDQLLHDVRNIVVVGTAPFPTSSGLNPSLTAAAMSIRAARRQTGTV